MIINRSSDEDDLLGTTTNLMKLRSQIESSEDKRRERGVKHLKKILDAYRKQENLEKADFHLLKGIFDHDPEAAEFKYTWEIVESDPTMIQNDAV